MNLFMVYNNLLASPTFWMLSLLIMTAGLLPDMTLKAFDSLNLRMRTVFPGNEKMGTLKFRSRLIETTPL